MSHSGKFYFQALIYFESFPNYFDAVSLDRNSYVFAKAIIFSKFTIQSHLLVCILLFRLYTTVGMYSAVSVHCYSFTFKCFVLIPFFWGEGIRLPYLAMSVLLCLVMSISKFHSSQERAPRFQTVNRFLSTFFLSVLFIKKKCPR